MLFLLGSGIGIRTPTNRVRVCRATFTQFRYLYMRSNGTHILLYSFFQVCQYGIAFVHFFFKLFVYAHISFPVT